MKTTKKVSRDTLAARTLVRAYKPRKQAILRAATHHTELTRNCYRCHAPIPSGFSYCNPCYNDLPTEKRA